MKKKVILRVYDIKKEMTSIFIVDEEEADSVIHMTNESPVKIYLSSKMDTEPIKLKNNAEISDYARHFDIQRVFECCRNINPECIHFLAEEAAFTEEYCEYILDLCEKLSQDSQYVEIAKRIADTILEESVNIIKAHMAWVEKAYYSFHNKNKPDTIDIDAIDNRPEEG